jgi:serine/threonine protein kinase
VPLACFSLRDYDVVHPPSLLIPTSLLFAQSEHIVFKTGDVNSPIKIIDFGVATIHRPGDAPLTTFAGSVRSVAPEIIKGKYGRECDLWSIGVIVYFLLTQEMPFDGQSNDQIFSKIVSGKFYYPQWTVNGLTEGVKHFIDHLLLVDPRRRMTAKEAMSHSWIRGSSTQSRQLVVRPQHTTRRQGYY